MANVRRVAWLLGGAIFGCDSDPMPHYPDGDGVEIGGQGAVDLACARYCNASFSVGCPAAFDTCEDSCKTLFHGTCEQKLADYLACVPMALTQTCLVGSPPAPSGPCSTTEDDLLDCLPCGDGEASMTGQRGCESNYSCGLMTSCDDDGFCTCVVAGELAATCRAVIGGIQACLPGTTCCGAFLQ